MATKRIETTTSRTAEWTCLTRAISSLEKDVHYQCDDDIALRLLPDHFRMLLRIPSFGRMFIHAVAARGMYEYVIARTKYIDSVFKEALTNGFDQILIFGAGFDTRALRFQNTVGTKIFELDVPITQEAKLRQYRKRGLRVPPGVTFIPIDFDRESLPIKLQETGFIKGKRTLFILEGLFMYLQPDSVHETLQTIQGFAGAGSEIVFDYVYASVLRGEGRYEGEKKIVESVAKAGEDWQFGIEEGQLGSFLLNHGFRLCEEANAAELEQKYFTDTSGRVVGKVNRTHCLVRAARM
jgi:methyltransferase (TIGR00027 family)